MTEKALEAVEHIKSDSNLLRGSLVESLADDVTGAIADDDTQLSKFHGIYQQDDRDLRADRSKRKLEPAYSFMIRARVPGGICTAAQWLAFDAIAQEHADGTLRLTTRQAFQLHGVIKRNLKTTIAAINQSLLDTIAACGDVNRNVMCSIAPERSALHAEVAAAAAALSAHLTPETRAYHEIWLDGKKATEGPETEPIYGASYLPRKFKAAFAIPPNNDVDVLAHDLGFIAIADGEEIVGYNVTVGGGMGATHGDSKTHPRLADTLGRCRKENVNAIAEAVVTTQRDYGDRTNRKHARLKYTIEDRGLDWFRAEVEKRSGVTFEKPADLVLTTTGDSFGWHTGTDNSALVTLAIPQGRVRDLSNQQWLRALRELAQAHSPEFRITPNQNLTVKVAGNDRDAVDSLLKAHGIDTWRRQTPMALDAMACVALPTCGLAMAEAERYLPDFVKVLHARLHAHGIDADPLLIRITGCPNGCARPYLAEIGLVGKAPGRYNLFLAGGADGQRLNRMTHENLNEAEILAVLDPLFENFADSRNPAERFGDFLHRRDDLLPPRAE